MGRTDSSCAPPFDRVLNSRSRKSVASLAWTRTGSSSRLRKTIVPPRAEWRSDPGMHHFNAGAAARAAVPACRGASVGRHAKKRALRLGGEQHPASSATNGALPSCAIAWIARATSPRPAPASPTSITPAGEAAALPASVSTSRMAGDPLKRLKEWSVSLGSCRRQSFAL